MFYVSKCVLIARFVWPMFYANEVTNDEGQPRACGEGARACVGRGRACACERARLSHISVSGLFIVLRARVQHFY